MGFTHVEIDVANVSEPGKHRSIEFLADTGALLTVVPSLILRELDIEPIGEREFRGFGGLINRKIGGAQFYYEDSITVAPIIFGEPDDTPVLGVTALEALGYQVDPVSQRLIKVESLQL